MTALSGECNLFRAFLLKIMEEQYWESEPKIVKLWVGQLNKMKLAIKLCVVERNSSCGCWFSFSTSLQRSLETVSVL